MRPPKHSPLFMAIAVALAIMLFISYPIPVYAIPVAPIIGILSLAFGLFSGWVLFDGLKKRLEALGLRLIAM